MLPWIEIDTADVPGGGGQLRLKSRGQEFSIMLGSNELMNSRLSGSEEALASLAREKIGDRPRPAFLIGGLGMGFTLRAALAILPGHAKVVVAELVPAVVRWARGPMASVFKGCLDDHRVTIYDGDVGACIAAARSAYDAILLDVDNGPDGLTRASNDSLYDHQGLRAAQSALRPGGVLAVWSSGPDPRFTHRLKVSGFEAEAVSTRANGKRGGARHVIWLAVKR
ncbi:spermine/spermidine synthase [Rhizobium sp. PP-F2F-G36]|nr:spermine/spermidine synthase [Rhizobium sp. PP-F2F-G36]